MLDGGIGLEGGQPLHEVAYLSSPYWTGLHISPTVRWRFGDEEVKPKLKSEIKELIIPLKITIIVRK